MEALINAIEQNRLLEVRRVDDAPASKQRDVRVETEQPTSEPRTVEPKEPKPIEIEKAAARLNEALESFSKDLAISVHKDTGRLLVRVTDPNTGDVLRQLPPEQLLEAEVTINKIIGLFVNDQV